MVEHIRRPFQVKKGRERLGVRSRRFDEVFVARFEPLMRGNDGAQVEPMAHGLGVVLAGETEVGGRDRDGCERS